MNLKIKRFFYTLGTNKFLIYLYTESLWILGDRFLKQSGTKLLLLACPITFSLKKSGKEICPEDETKLLQEITDKYNEELSPYYAAARLWVDGVIDPLETRKIISIGISAANNSPITKPFNLGILQT